MAKILVTGATGFIGQRLIERMRERDQVWGLVRTTPTDAPHDIYWLRHNLAAGGLPDDMPAEIDAVIHLAQSRRFREFPSAAREMFAVNAAATLELLDWGRRAGARHFVFASTGGLYGWSEHLVQESDPAVMSDGPLAFYFTTKRSGELMVERFSQYVTTVVLRFFFVYGAGQREHMLFPRLVTAVREGRPLTLQGESGIRINPIHVNDAVAAIERSLNLRESQTINVAGPETAPLRQIGELIGALVGRPVCFDVDQTACPRHLVADISHMCAVLGSPEVGLAEGLTELVRGAPAAPSFGLRCHLT